MFTIFFYCIQYLQCSVQKSQPHMATYIQIIKNSVPLATLQVPNSYTWLVVTILDSTHRRQLTFYESTGLPMQMTKFTQGHKHKVTFIIFLNMYYFHPSGQHFKTGIVISTLQIRKQTPGTSFHICLFTNLDSLCQMVLHLPPF